jgi:signal transduction histidine kinase
MIRAFFTAALRACLLLALAGAAAHAAADVVELRTGSYLIGGDAAAGTLPPGDDAPWQALQLPQQVSNPSKDLVRAWFRLPFRLDSAPDKPLAVMLPRVYSGGDVFLNGELVGRIEGSSPTLQAHWLRPHYFPLPAKLLRAGENSLAIGVSSRYTQFGIGPPVIGSPEAVKPLHEDRLFIEYSMALVAVWLMLTGGAFLLVVWLARRQETVYAIFGAAMLGWAIRTLNHVVPYTPLDWWVLWRVLFYAGTGFGDMLLCIFLLRMSGARYPRIERLMLACAPMASIAMLVLGQDFLKFDGLWYLSLLPFNVLAFYSIGRAAWRARTWDLVTLASALGVAILFMLRDTAVQMNLLPFSSVYLTHIGAPFAVLAMSTILLVRFVDVLKKIEGMNLELEQRVQEREAELIANHAALRQMELAQAAADERQRIMQDMHDGLGSQLLSSLAMVERGAADDVHVAQVLRECIDDMRLVIDALTPGENDLLAALGTLRFRMEPRLRAAGIELRWKVDYPGDGIEVEPRHGLALLRIVQEAIANVLKHADASRLEVSISTGAGGLEIRIADNGRGFDPAASTPGRGQSHMRRRAAGVGAELEVSSSPAGTQVRLASPC